MKTDICIRALTVLIFVFVVQHAFGQATNNTVKEKAPEVVTFVVIFDTTKETKDGYYLNGYVVNIDHKQAKKLNGKKIRVTGSVTIIKGLDDQPQEHDSNGNPIITQGRNQDTRHILNPGIEIVD